MGNQSSVLLEAASTGNVKRVQQVLSKTDASVVNCKGQDNWTALHYAACSGHLAVTETLLRYDADANATEQIGRTPLHLAARNGHTEVVACLIKAGALVNASDHEGMTPLALAAAKGHARAAGELKWGGADLNIKLATGATPLHLASCYGHAPVVELLLQQRDVNVNAKDSNGYTPLMEAAAQGHLGVVKQLLRSRSGCAIASANMTDKAGKCAADMAQEQGHTDVVRHLMSYTDRVQSHHSPNRPQGSAAPSAPPWQPPSPYQAALHQSALPQASSSASTMVALQGDSSSQPARSALTRSNSYAATSGAVSYPAVYTSPSMQSLAGLNAAPGTASRSGSLPAHQASQSQQRGGRSFSPDGLQAQAVQADTPKLGHIPAAVSFILGKVQAVLPDMLRPMPASEPDSPQDRHYSGPYGLVDGSDEAVGEADDSEERAATTAGGGTPGERSTQDDQMAQRLQGMQLQDRGPNLPMQQPIISCSLFSYPSLARLCNGFSIEQQLRSSSRTYRGRYRDEDVAVTIYEAFADNEESTYSHWLESWLERNSHLQHPYVLPLLGACLSPPALVAPLMQNGTLDGALRGVVTPGGGSPPSLPCHQRMHIVAACADALSYLQSHSPQLMAHQLSASHILLDQDMMPRLSSHVRLQWTCKASQSSGWEQQPGESALLNNLGLIMLQLLTGREAQASLRRHVERHVQSGSLSSILDGSCGVWPSQPTKHFASLALSCMNPRCAERPSLAQAVVPQLAALAAAAAAAAASEPTAASAPSVNPRWKEASQEPQPWFECPISHEVMEDPVVAADGQTYDRVNIQQWFDRGKRSSPITGAHLPHTRLTPVYAIKSAIREWQQHKQQKAA